MRDKKIVMGQVFVKKCDDMGTISGDNTEKIMAHRFFAKQKTDVSKACKMAAGGYQSQKPPVLPPVCHIKNRQF